MSEISMDDRWLNLATILLGEALTTMSNIRQRGGVPGADFNPVRHTLAQAIHALHGETFTPVIDSQHIQISRGK